MSEQKQEQPQGEGMTTKNKDEVNNTVENKDPKTALRRSKNQPSVMEDREGKKGNIGVDRDYRNDILIQTFPSGIRRAICYGSKLEMGDYNDLITAEQKKDKTQAEISRMIVEQIAKNDTKVISELIKREEKNLLKFTDGYNAAMEDYYKYRSQVVVTEVQEDRNEEMDKLAKDSDDFKEGYDLAKELRVKYHLTNEVIYDRLKNANLDLDDNKIGVILSNL